MRDNKTLMKSYIASYNYLHGFVQNACFEEKPELVVVSLHMVYGWMPTALNLVKYEKVADSLSPDKLRKIGQILDRAKKAESFKEIFSSGDFSKLKTFINNSVVGASKILHFCKPDVFAIFDSKICNALFYPKFPSKNGHHIPTITEYQSYLEGLHNLIQDLNTPNLNTLRLNKIFSPDYQSSISLIRQVESKIFEIASRKNGDLSENGDLSLIRSYFKK